MKTIELIEELSPHRSYRVFARNREYTGDSFGVKFNEGEALVYALPSQANERQCARRVEGLTALLNAEPILKQIDARTFRHYRAYVITELRPEDLMTAVEDEPEFTESAPADLFLKPGEDDEVPEAPPAVPDEAFAIATAEDDEAPQFEVPDTRRAASTRPRSRASA